MASFLYSFWLIWVISITVILGDTQSTFEPRLQWICTPFSMVLTVITDHPFDGIANSKGYRSTCFTTGNGTTETNLIIPLGGKDKKCGVKFCKVTKTFWVEVEVHPHNAIISDLDPTFNVSCDISSMSYQPKIDYFLELYTLPEAATNLADINNQASFESPKTNGKTYILDAFMASIDDVLKYRNHFKMTNCIVESDGTNTVEIIDSNGCSINPKQITNVVYTDEWASVNFTDVNPYLKVLKLKCKFSICDKNEICRENCDQHWYDSIEKGGKKFAKWLGFGDSSKTAAINDPLLSKGKSTIVHISVPLKPDDALPPQINFFVEKCQKIDLYFFTFEHCCSTFGTFWLYVGIASVWLILFGSVLLNLFCCFRSFKGKNGSDSDSGDYWVYEDMRQKRKTSEDEPLPRRKSSLLRRLSKRRNAHSKDDEIYATIKSRSSTHRLKIIAPVIYDKPSPKVAPLSQIYENPYITLPSFAKPSKALERGSSIEENPVYVCQKTPHSGFI